MSDAIPVPPHLTMDQYADWVASNLKNQDPERIRRQKANEEQVTIPFRILPDKPSKPQMQKV